MPLGHASRSTDGPQPSNDRSPAPDHGPELDPEDGLVPANRKSATGTISPRVRVRAIPVTGAMKQRPTHSHRTGPARAGTAQASLGAALTLDPQGTLPLLTCSREQPQLARLRTAPALGRFGVAKRQGRHGRIIDSSNEHPPTVALTAGTRPQRHWNPPRTRYVRQLGGT